MHAKLRAEDLYTLTSGDTTRRGLGSFSLFPCNLQRTQNLLDYATGSMEIHSILWQLNVVGNSW